MLYSLSITAMYLFTGQSTSANLSQRLRLKPVYYSAYLEVLRVAHLVFAYAQSPSKSQQRNTNVASILLNTEVSSTTVWHKELP